MIIKCGVKVTSIGRVEAIASSEFEGQRVEVRASDGPDHSFEVCYSSKTMNYQEDESISRAQLQQVQSIRCHSIIMATGSSRVGYGMLQRLGHALVRPLPSLFSFKIAVSRRALACGQVLWDNGQ